MSEHLTSWLMDAGGPVIRYRTATELMDGVPEAALAVLRNELLESPMVRLWLERLDGLRGIHNSGNDILENVAGRLLVEFGLRADFAPLGSLTDQILERMTAPPHGWLDEFERSILAWAAVWAGITHHAITDFMAHRLDVLSNMARTEDYDIYAPPGTYTDLPARYRDVPVVDPRLYPAFSFEFPVLHDILWMAKCPVALLGPDAARKIDDVVRYVLDPRYQALRRGYGMIRAGKRHYYVMGWSVHLPGYGGAPVAERNAPIYLQWLDILGRLPVAREHAWFQSGLDFVRGFRTTEGRYRFPRAFLPERASGYWVLGAHMGLEDNRRSEHALEVESTFRALRLQRAADAM